MKISKLIFIASIYFLGSCGKGNDSENSKIEFGSSNLESNLLVISDPDTSDQIAPDQYLIDAISDQTATLVRNRLLELLENDLKIGIVDSLSRKFIFFEYDLDENGSKEIFVGLTGPYFCGSGGCTQFVLSDQGEVITKFTVSDYPVVISRDKTKGWSDLYILSGSEYHVVKSDGKAYPSNPSILPKLGMIPGDGLPRALDFMNDNYPWFGF